MSWSQTVGLQSVWHLFAWRLPHFYSKIKQRLNQIQTAKMMNTFRQKIEDLAGSLKFPLKKLFVIDGSKRSAHSNAYMWAPSAATSALTSNWWSDRKECLSANQDQLSSSPALRSSSQTQWKGLPVHIHSPNLQISHTFELQAQYRHEIQCRHERPEGFQKRPSSTERNLIALMYDPGFYMKYLLGRC